MNIIILILINFLFSQALTDISFISSKSFGLAGAVVSNPDNLESVFYNPAGIKKLNKKITVLSGKTQLYGLSFLDYEYLSIGFANSMAFTYQKLGTSYKGSSNYDDEFSDFGFDSFDGSLSTEKSFTFTHGISLLDDKNSKISFGYNLNYLKIFQNASAGPNGDGQNGLGAKDIDSFGIDIGLLASLRDKVSFGAYVKNINNPKLSKGSSSSHLPRRLDLGITYYPFEQLTTTFAVERVLGYDESSFRFGVEYELSSSLLLRTGIQLNPNRYGAGFSYKVKNFELSYSILTHSVLPITDVFNLKVYFD